MRIQVELQNRARILHASSAWGSDEDGALMDLAGSQIGQLVAALQWLESYLKDTPHHNAPAAANARDVLRKVGGDE